MVNIVKEMYDKDEEKSYLPIAYESSSQHAASTPPSYNNHSRQGGYSHGYNNPRPQTSNNSFTSTPYNSRNREPIGIAAPRPGYYFCIKTTYFALSCNSYYNLLFFLLAIERRVDPSSFIDVDAPKVKDTEIDYGDF